MASNEVESHQDYEEHEEDHVLYKEKYLQLRKKHKQLAALYDHNLSDNDDNDEESFEPPAKKQKLNEQMEGFGRLPFELIDKIFSYLKPKEVLDSMLVSKCWKYFIESRYLSKVMDKVVVKFDRIEEYGVEEMDVAATNSRSYKHVEAKFGVKVMQQFPFSAYASSLESLKINCNKTLGLKVEPGDFLKMKKLIVECQPDEDEHFSYDDYDFHDAHDECQHENLISFIKASSFPEVTHLQMPVYDTNQISLAQLLQKFPKLRVLLLLSSENEYVEGDMWHEMLESYKSSKNQPKLEAICMDCPGENFHENLLLGFKDSLTEVCIDETVDTKSLITILKNLGNLQSLSIYRFWTYSSATEPFPRHEKLQTLSIHDGSDREEFKEFLLQLPSLHTLIIHASATKELVEFLASNIASLKKVIFNSATKETRKFCGDLKKKKKGNNQFINTDFEIHFKTHEELLHDRSNMQTFYDKHFK